MNAHYAVISKTQDASCYSDTVVQSRGRWEAETSVFFTATSHWMVWKAW